MPLVCMWTMYLEFISTPIDQELQEYPSVLDYGHPDGKGEPSWTTDPNDRSQLIPTKRNLEIMLIELYKFLTYLMIHPAHNLSGNKCALTHTHTDYEKLMPYVCWVNTDVVKQTLGQTTQWGVAIASFPMKRQFKSRNHPLDVPRRHVSVATDTIFSDTPAVDSGIKQAQVFVGRDFLVADVYSMKSGKQFVNTLEDKIQRWGGMDMLLSHSAKIKTSSKVMDILRAYHISN